jgi:hypothetical protein
MYALWKNTLGRRGSEERVFEGYGVDACARGACHRGERMFEEHAIEGESV